MRLTEKEMQQRREMIIMTAFRLFCSEGIEHVTIARIARESKVGETTVYRYFANKTELVLQTFLRVWDMIMTQVERTVESVAEYSDMSGYRQIETWLRAFQVLYSPSSEDFVLFSYEAKLYLVRQKVKLDLYCQDLLMHAVKGPCIAAFEKGKLDGSISSQLTGEDFFYTAWGAVRGYIVKIVIYGKLYGEDSPWKSRYLILTQSILELLQRDGTA